MKFKFLNIAFSFERVMPGKDYLNPEIKVSENDSIDSAIKKFVESK